MGATTPTGVAILPCVTCGLTHPVTRSHCVDCVAPSLFLNEAGRCINCAAVMEVAV